MNECDAAICQFAQAPVLWDLVQQRNKLQLALDLLVVMVMNNDWEAVGEAGKKVGSATAAMLQDPLSEEDYMTLTSRHSALVQKMTDTCKDLLATKQYDSVTALGTKLKELKAAQVSAENKLDAAQLTALEDSKAAELSELILSCDAVVPQFADVPALQNAIHFRNEPHSEITQLRNIGSNFKDIVRVGKALKAAKAAVALQPLSEEDYLTLAERHAALVEDVTYQCERLADAENYDAVEALEAKLAELSVLEVQSGAYPATAVQDAPDIAVEVPKTCAAEVAPPVFCNRPIPPLFLPAPPLRDARDPPDWVHVGFAASTAITSSEDFPFSDTAEKDRVAMFRVLPSCVKCMLSVPGSSGLTNWTVVLLSFWSNHFVPFQHITESSLCVRRTTCSVIKKTWNEVVE
jgi:hypothetical protein